MLCISQQTQNMCITFVQLWPNVLDVGPTLYKCYTNVLCLLWSHCFILVLVYISLFHPCACIYLTVSSLCLCISLFYPCACIYLTVPSLCLYISHCFILVFLYISLFECFILVLVCISLFHPCACIYLTVSSLCLCISLFYSCACIYLTVSSLCFQIWLMKTFWDSASHFSVRGSTPWPTACLSSATAWLQIRNARINYTEN